MARHIAARCASKGVKNVLDPFVGVGGNLIQFARECGFCWGVDLEREKTAMAYHNARNVYQVPNSSFKVF